MSSKSAKRQQTGTRITVTVPPDHYELVSRMAKVKKVSKAWIIRNARVRAVLAANPIVIEAYWQTGKIILARQQEAAWGAKVIDRHAADLKEAFPDMSGLSPRNLLAMKVFAREFPDGPIVKQLVSQLPWGQINLYRAAVDDLLRHPDDLPTIGLLLCRGKNKLVVEPNGVRQIRQRRTRRVRPEVESICPERFGQIHRRLRLENPNHRIPPCRISR